MKGFDCFVLLFNTCVYQKLKNVEIYNEFEYDRNEENIIKVLNSSLINLQGIDPLKEYYSSSVCQRLKRSYSSFDDEVKGRWLHCWCS